MHVLSWFPFDAFETHWVLNESTLLPLPGKTHVFKAPMTGISRIAWSRQEAEDELVEDGERYFILDDNIKRFTCLHPDIKLPLTPADYADVSRRVWDEWFSHPIEVADLANRISRAPRNGLVALAPRPNPMYRMREWSFKAYCKTKFALVKKNGTRFFPENAPEDFIWEDMYRTLQNHGDVATYNHAYPEHTLCERGGWLDGDRGPVIRASQRWFVDQGLPCYFDKNGVFKIR